MYKSTIKNENMEGNETVRKASKEKIRSDSRENSNTRKKMKLKSESEDNSKTPKNKPMDLETDQSVLQRRQKQIDYGKNTVGYHNYTKLIPFDKRTKENPKTPDKYTKYSRRSWDMLIKIWRKELHKYDTDSKEEVNSSSESDSQP